MIYSNPISKRNEISRDPVIVSGQDGWYYSCRNAVKGVAVRRFKTLKEFDYAEERMVYQCTDTDCPRDWYAPELHFIDGFWYIYGAPAIPEMSEVHSMYVLRSRTTDPFGDYEFMGPVKGLEKKWAIDGTVFEYARNHYMVVNYQGLSIAKMEDPCSLSGEPVTIASAEYPWECVRTPIVEGPAILKKNDRVYIVYSASDSQCDAYCLGILTFKGEDLLCPMNWEKHPKPVFETANGLYGPGHCSFSVMEGREIIVYHANPVSGSGWSGSFMCVQPFSWENDFPVFKEPVRKFEL